MSPRHQTTKNVFFVATAKIFSLASLLIASILVARITDPVSFGYYSVAISLVLLMEAVTGAPLDNAVVRFSSLHRQFPEKIESVQGFIFKIKIAVGSVLLIVVSLFLPFFTNKIFDISAPKSILIVSVLSLISVLIVRSSASFLQINNRFASYSNIDTLQGVFRLSLTGIIFLYGCTSVVWYLVVYGVSAALTFVINLFLHNQKFLRAPPPSNKDRGIVFSYIGVTSIIIILGSITGRIDLPLLSTISGAQQAAYYSVASQIASMGTLLASYIAIVFQPKVVQMAKDGTLGAAINKNILVGLVMTMIGLPIAFYLSPKVIPWIFGQPYIYSVAVFNILIIGVCADLFTMPILMPYAIQVIPGRILVGETIITLGFMICVFLVFNIDLEIMAWIATGTRVIKLFMYYIFVRLKIMTT